MTANDLADEDLDERVHTALEALLARLVWDTEHNPECIVIEGGGYSDGELLAIVREWLCFTEDDEAAAAATVRSSFATDCHLAARTIVYVDRNPRSST